MDQPVVHVPCHEDRRFRRRPRGIDRVDGAAPDQSHRQGDARGFVAAQLEKRVLKRAKVAKQPTVTTDTPRVNSKPIVILEVSPNPDSSKSQVISDRDLLILRRCQNFSEQINTLERMISKAIDPDEMDKFFLKLVEYEKSYVKNCKN